MSPSFTLFLAQDHHIEAVFALHELLFRPHIEQIWGWDQDWQWANFQHQWKEVDTKILEACGMLVGYVQTQLYPDHLLLKSLGLVPSHQNLGIGTDLITDLQAQCRALGRPLRLSVFSTNPRAQQFYARAGCVRCGRTTAFQHMSWSNLP